MEHRTITFRYFIFMVCLTSGFISCVFLYSKGFLLNRNVILKKSVCSKYDTVGQIVNMNNGSFQTCYLNDFKIIFIIIDALRYDFVAKFSGEDQKYYHNSFNNVHNLLSDNQHARLFQFIADPPTTTMQRLHGLMTGSLPTFVDIGSNFASSEIKEDNLLFQLQENGKKAVFLGDDTWMNLFPKHFERFYPYSSFNVWDLDTVDKGVSENIFREINKDDWNLLIAHYLGVDHCGHRFGPNHPEMKRKLLEMDDIINDIVKIMDEKTVLFVMGDHGMTESGDHGGASDDEITAALFVYSKSVLNSLPSFHTEAIHQIDILPTVSIILGVPIPFSNLGILVFEIIPMLSSSSTNSSISDYVHSQMVKSNVNQIVEYVRIYNRKYGHFPPLEFENILQKYHSLPKYNTILSRNDLLNANSFMKSVQSMCKIVWTQFDFISIIVGLSLFLLFLFFVFIINGANVKMEKLNINYFFIYLLVTIFLMIISNYLYILKSHLIIIVFIYIGTFNLMIYCSEFHSFSFMNCPIFVKYSLLDFSSLIIFCSSFLGLFSNSYIVTESFVVTFLLMTMIWIGYFHVFISKRELLLGYTILGIRGKTCVFFTTVSLCFILRILSNFWKCYDELSINCESFKASTFVSVSVSVIAIFLFLKVVTLSLFTYNYSLRIIFFKKVFNLLIMLCCLFWVLNLYVTSQNIRHFEWIINILPLAIALFALIGITHCFIWPSQFVCEFSMVDWVKKKYIFLKIYVVFGTLCLILSLTIFSERRVVSIILLFFSLILLIFLLGLNRALKMNTYSDIFNISFWDLIAWHLSCIVHFYSTGHQPTFPSLQWEAVGPFIQIFPMFVPGLLMVVNTFISYIMHSLLLPLLIVVPISLFIHIKQDKEFSKMSLIPRKQWAHVMMNLFLKSICLHALRVLMIMLSAAIQCRHLMVWKIFAPKLIFEALGFCVSLFVSILSFIFVNRISFLLEA